MQYGRGIETTHGDTVVMEVRRRSAVNVAERDRSLVGRGLTEALTRVQRRHEGVRIDCQDV